MEFPWVTSVGVELSTKMNVEFDIRKDKKLIQQFIQELGVDQLHSQEWLKDYLTPLLKICVNKVSREFSLYDFQYRPKKIVKRAMELIPNSSQYLELKKVSFLDLKNRKIERLEKHLKNKIKHRIT